MHSSMHFYFQKNKKIEFYTCILKKKINQKSIMKNEVLCIHSHLIKNKNMHFHHSFNKQKWKLCITYILINHHHRILCICSCILSALMHFFLNANIKKFKNIKNEKYCIHSCILVLTSLLIRFILRPAWCGYGLNLNFSKKKYIWVPLGTVKSTSWPHHRKIRANKIVS